MCTRCGAKLSMHNKGDVCSLCLNEIERNLERVREIWAYSEPRIRGLNRSPEYSTLRVQGYSLLLYTLLDTFRVKYPYTSERSDYFVGDWHAIANEVSIYRRTLNHGGFIQTVFKFLVDTGYIRPAGTNPLNPREPRYRVSLDAPDYDV